MSTAADEIGGGRPSGGVLGRPEDALQQEVALHEEATAVFRDLALVLYRGGDIAAVYQEICDAASRVVPGCDHASMMLRRGGKFVVVGASDAIAAHASSVEIAVNEGPCLDAIVDEPIQHDPDITGYSSWPAMARRILDETPVRGMAGFRLVLDEKKVGSLNLFSDTAGALNQASLRAATVLAAFASVTVRAVLDRQDVESLRAGMASNREIGKAIGLMMAFHKISSAAAFEMLRRTSQDLNIRMTEVARQVVDHHEGGI